MNVSRRASMLGAVFVLAAGVSAALAGPTNPPPVPGTITVYKMATCGCCAKWMSHLREHGFTVIGKNVSETELVAMKREAGVPSELESCHTALVDGYVVEGHVPADVLQDFLDEHPMAVGLAVPGMPLGSPGMESDVTEAYDVLLFDASGKATVYRSR